MLQATRDGGVTVLQILNLWRLPDGPCVWQKCRRSQTAHGQVMVWKGVHRCGNTGFVDLLVTTLDKESVFTTESIPFLGLEASTLDRLARAAGARDVTCFGGYGNQTFDRQSSTDLILVARK